MFRVHEQGWSLVCYRPCGCISRRVGPGYARSQREKKIILPPLLISHPSYLPLNPISLSFAWGPRLFPWSALFRACWACGQMQLGMTPRHAFRCVGQVGPCHVSSDGFCTCGQDELLGVLFITWLLSAGGLGSVCFIACVGRVFVKIHYMALVDVGRSVLGIFHPNARCMCQAGVCEGVSKRFLLNKTPASRWLLSL
jgi:hypothetical protein